MPDIGLSGTLSVKMALTYSAFAIMVVSTLVTLSKATADNGTAPVIKPILDPKRRNELIDEAFLEQKDMLLDMLETKLKEVRDKKKKENVVENTNETDVKCESMPSNVDVVLKAHGISAIGDTDVRLKYGESGNGTLSLDATGISNVGKVHLELGVADGNVHIPGLDDVFTGEMLLKKKCRKENGAKVYNNIISSTTISGTKPEIELDYQETRRVDKGEEKLDTVSPLNETSNYVEKPENNDIHNNENDDNKSSSRIDSTTVTEETRSVTELVNDTDTLTLSSA